MKECGRVEKRFKEIFVGIDLHLGYWHVTVRDEERELYSGRIVGQWEEMRRVLERYRAEKVETVYEAGYFGFWLHDRLVEWGAQCVVTPPSLIPVESGNRVKTDRRDSRKLALLLSKGMLKAVWVPSREGVCHRQVIRRRRQLVGDRVRVQNRIKSEMRFYGLELPAASRAWSAAYVSNLGRVKLGDRYLQQSFRQLLVQYRQLSEQIARQTELLKELSETAGYSQGVKLLRTIPGIGLIGAMEWLLELGDITRFVRQGQVSAYVGLTQAQYSSGEKVRMGRITCTGKGHLRGVLIEASWTLIRKDRGMRSRYERIKMRSGGKRAIVAVARNLAERIRLMQLREEPYRLGRAA